MHYLGDIIQSNVFSVTKCSASGKRIQTKSYVCCLVDVNHQFDEIDNNRRVLIHVSILYVHVRFVCFCECNIHN